jgi:hypothetical protein
MRERGKKEKVFKKDSILCNKASIKERKPSRISFKARIQMRRAEGTLFVNPQNLVDRREGPEGEGGWRRERKRSRRRALLYGDEGTGFAQRPCWPFLERSLLAL